MQTSCSLEHGYDAIGARWLAAMRAGDFEAAWRETDRIELPRRAAAQAGHPVAHPAHLVWDGSAFAGRRVRVRCNHGLGDTLQFIRFVPGVVALAREVTVLVQPHLVALLAGDPRFGHVIDGWTDDPPPCDVEIEVMELAYACRATPQTLPCAPYLPVARAERERRLLPPWNDDGALRVGLLWAASDWDSTRSVPTAALGPLSAVPRVRLYSLQQGRQQGEWRSAALRMQPLSAHTAAVEGAAGALLDMDLVITVDGMLAHLAGGLGRPVWVMLQHECDWRWMARREDSPWYPTMRLFRQPRPGDWRGLVRNVATALGLRARDPLNRRELARPSRGG